MEISVDLNSWEKESSEELQEINQIVFDFEEGILLNKGERDLVVVYLIQVYIEMANIEVVKVIKNMILSSQGIYVLVIDYVNQNI